MRWVIRQADLSSIRALSESLGVSPLLARLLALRGVGDPASAQRFLSPALDHLHDPFHMRSMDTAVRRIVQAIENREKILIYGDYDVDGAMAVVILDAALKLVGAQAHHHIPHRMREGYGMRTEVVEQARADGFSVLISVDTGIRAFAVVERARELGLDCIITDHHLPASEAGEGERLAQGVSGFASVPRALAVLNPKQPGCPYPDKNLCGAGVAFKLAQALLASCAGTAARLPRLLPSFLKLVCIGTIADSVPLVGENRVIASLGLEGLQLPVNPGLKALVEAAGLDPANSGPITSWDVGFRLAPRLNAAGRMESAQDVIDLFTRAGPAEAQQLALKLNRLNAERQAAEQAILAEIEERIERQPEEFSAPCLVVAGEGWHRGVIGIVASRLVDRFHRPALVISVETGAGYGSGRSIERFHLLDALTECADVFDRFGGHRQAVGFALPADRIADLRGRMNQYAGRCLAPDDFIPDLEIDGEISLSDLSSETVQELHRLAPHGYGNPRPVFGCRAVRLRGRPRLLKDRHLKMQVAQGSLVFTALGWRKGPPWIERLEHLQRLSGPDAAFDVAFSLTQNAYQGDSRTELELIDISA
jgi:single-stranded-DNA-specific exonuclease